MIWLVYRTDRIGYDEYGSHVVIADTEEEVSKILDEEFYYTGSPPNWWADGEPKKHEIVFENLSNRKEKGVVLSSFNAG